MNVPESTGGINFHFITEEKGVGFRSTERSVEDVAS